jgi:peptide/nickel transport system ATP-binding protein
MSAAVRVTDLRLSASSPLVQGVSFEVAAGEALGIVGESGSGKSLTLRAILDLLPSGVTRTGGTIETAGRVGMVFQDPLTALDPLARVGGQVVEVVRAARRCTRAVARERVLDLFERVHLPDPEAKLRAYPNELSGGQRQRVVIAMALATDPEILLCDEPTTALDVTVQRQILALLEQLRTELGLAMVFVSHDLAVVGAVCSRLLVMSGGRVVEQGPTARVIADPQDPYTRMLLAAVLPLPALAPVAGEAAR